MGTHTCPWRGGEGITVWPRCLFLCCALRVLSASPRCGSAIQEDPYSCQSLGDFKLMVFHCNFVHLKFAPSFSLNGLRKFIRERTELSPLKRRSQDYLMDVGEKVVPLRNMAWLISRLRQWPKLDIFSSRNQKGSAPGDMVSAFL